MITRKSEGFLKVPGSSLSSFKDGERRGDIFFPKKCKGFYTMFSCSDEKGQMNHKCISTHSGYCDRLKFLKRKYYVI